MSMIIKILILLSIITISLQRRCVKGINCEVIAEEDCGLYYSCALHMTILRYCFNDYEDYRKCCSEDKEGNPCAKVVDGKPVCEDTEPDNLCPEQKLSFLE
jgi:hypothetical protein